MILRDKIMFEILRAIITGEKRAGETVVRKDYNINKKQMTEIFRKLADNDIIEQSVNSIYTVTGRGEQNAQELCFEEIAQRLEDIEDIMVSGNISDEMLINFIRIHISDRRQAAQAADKRWEYTNR